MSNKGIGYLAAGIATAVTAIYSPICAIFVAGASFSFVAESQGNDGGSQEGDQDD